MQGGATQECKQLSSAFAGGKGLTLVNVPHTPSIALLATGAVCGLSFDVPHDHQFVGTCPGIVSL